MKNQLFLLLFGYVLNVNGQNVTIDWNIVYGGTGVEYGMDVVVDLDGNIIVTGYFSDTVDFDPGIATDNRISVGLHDIFITKINPDGDHLWTLTFGSIGNDEGGEIIITPENDYVVTGFFTDSIDFDPGPAADWRMGAGGQDAFLMRLDSDGNIEWSHNFGGFLSDYFSRIRLDYEGNIIAAGQYSDTIDFDPGPGQHILIAEPYTNYESVFLKYSHNGDFLWATEISGDHTYEHINGLTVDFNNNIYICGVGQEGTDLDPGADTFILHGPQWADLQYLAKYNENGSLIWANQYSEIDYTPFSYDYLNQIQFDEDGFLYMTGAYVDSFNLNPSGPDEWIYNGTQGGFLAKYDLNGQLLLHKELNASYQTINYTLYHIGFYDFCYDNHGGIYISGLFHGSVDFDPSPSDSYFVNSIFDEHDSFILKLNSAGEFQWAISLGSDNDDRSQAVTLDPDDGSIYWSTVFSDTLMADGLVLSNDFSLAGLFDIILTKIQQENFGIENAEDEFPVKIYPNPATTYLILEFDTKGLEQINIFDNQGRLVSSFNPTNKIDISFLENGYYYIELKLENFSLTQKFVIAR